VIHVAAGDAVKLLTSYTIDKEMLLFRTRENIAKPVLLRSARDDDLVDTSRIRTQCFQHGRNTEDDILRGSLALIGLSNLVWFGIRSVRPAPFHINSRRIREYFVN
jgi:hypothetical protein